MARANMYESTGTPTDRTDGTETQAPAAAALTDTPTGRPKDGAGNWGVSARWFLLALLAVAFFFALTVLRH